MNTRTCADCGHPVAEHERHVFDDAGEDEADVCQHPGCDCVIDPWSTPT